MDLSMGIDEIANKVTVLTVYSLAHSELY